MLWQKISHWYVVINCRNYAYLSYKRVTCVPAVGEADFYRKLTKVEHLIRMSYAD